MIRVLYSILMLLVTLNLSAQNVSKTNYPNWVTKIKVGDKEELEDISSYQYLLLDFQENIAKQEDFRHYAIKILNSDGIQNMSTISVDFDPNYQYLKFHSITLLRGNETIDKLKSAQIRTIQRETGMERSLYDGSITAVIDLSDVRAGDVLEYAYTIKGYNPINKGSYSNSIYLQFTTPCNRIFQKIIAKNEGQLQFKYLNGASKPKVGKSRSKATSYEWDVSGKEYYRYDKNTPYWFDDQKKVLVSTYKNWNDVVNWALPLYNFKSFAPNDIIDSITSKKNKKDRIDDIIRFVQDDVRYLGFESGIGAYKPNHPDKVLKQRFGDCKDKSLLLIALLRYEGVEAFPFLVNTSMKAEIDKALPSHSVFDHCIVNFSFDDKNYFIDPTISNQGGDINNIDQAFYDGGLLIKPSINELVQTNNKIPSTTGITEDYIVKEIGTSAIYKVKSEYTGAKADEMRAYFNTTSKAKVQQSYLDFYSDVFPSIEIEEPIVIDDSERNVSNRLFVYETYKINDFWTTSDDQTYIYTENYALELKSLINYDATAKRTQPFYAGTPFSYKVNTTYRMPESWSVTPVNKKIEGFGFNYKNEISGFGSVIKINYEYELSESTVPAELAEEFIEKHNEIDEDLYFYLTYNNNLAKNGSNLYIPILSSILVIGLCIFFCVRTYKKVDPSNDYTITKGKDIGGWLILPLIGLTLGPFTLLFSIVNAGFFSVETWSSLNAYEGFDSFKVGLMYVIELSLNLAMLSFAVLLAALFYTKRTSLPKLIVVYYLGHISIVLIDTFLIFSMLDGIDLGVPQSELVDYKSIFRSIISAAIWIPYFANSIRVKETFTRRYKDVHK